MRAWRCHNWGLKKWGGSSLPCPPYSYGLAIYNTHNPQFSFPCRSPPPSLPPSPPPPPLPPSPPPPSSPQPGTFSLPQHSPSQTLAVDIVIGEMGQLANQKTGCPICVLAWNGYMTECLCGNRTGDTSTLSTVTLSSHMSRYCPTGEQSSHVITQHTAHLTKCSAVKPSHEGEDRDPGRARWLGGNRRNVSGLYLKVRGTYNYMASAIYLH